MCVVVNRRIPMGRKLYIAPRFFAWGTVTPPLPSARGSQRVQWVAGRARGARSLYTAADIFDFVIVFKAFLYRFTRTRALTLS